MEELVPHLVRHFDGLQDRLVCFCDLGVQIEGWFKGELLTLLTSLRREGGIQEFDREVRVGRARVDILVRLRGERHWVELKHWLVGEQKGTHYDAAFYFGDPTSVGIVKDVDKLSGADVPGRKWLLVLLTANPGKDSWQKGLAKFRHKFSPRMLVPHTKPDQFPSTYFLGLLEVAGSR